MSMRASGRSKGSNVDQSLFGKKGAATRTGADCAIISKDEMRDIRSQIEKGKNTNNAAMISKAELDRIRGETVIKSVAQLRAERQLLDAQKESQAVSNKQRRERMSQADRLRVTKMSEMSGTQTKAKNNEPAGGLLAGAMEQLDEEHDDVKHMNQLMLQTKVMTIRDMQLAENKRLEEEWLAEQKRLDLMMEIERLKAIKEEQERAERKAYATRVGAQNLIDQIKERDQIRQRQEEMLEKEKEQMLMNIKKAKDEDVKKAEEQKKMVKIRGEEVKKANNAAISLKEEARLREKALEDEIVRVQKQKLEQEEAVKREQARIKEEKEKETQRLREMQERANDRQAELDEIKAKKAYEEKERKEFLQVKADQAKHKALIKDLEVSRRRQFKDKEARMADEAQKDRDLALKTAARLREEEEAERRLEMDRLAAKQRHQVALNSQIANNGEMRAADKADYEEQGRQLRQGIEDERQKILRIKERKMNQIDQMPMDVPEQYKHQLAKKKVIF